jgi:hypothetical protein
MPQLIVKSEPTKPEEGDARQKREEFLRLARERFKLASEAESQMRKEALEDLEFYSGDQWPANLVHDRTESGKPCLTINRLLQFVHQVTNDQRQARPAIQVNPTGEQSTVETAAVFQGLLRHIEVSSDAEIAYDTAFASAAICGFGYFRVVTEYADEPELERAGEDFLDQEIRIEPILDPFTVYFDPTCEKKDYSDAEFAFQIEDLTVAQFKERFPNAELAGLSEFRSIGDEERPWFPDGGIRTAAYWWVEKTHRTMAMLNDGTFAWLDEIEDESLIAERNGRKMARQVEARKVHCSRINAREILKEDEWGGRWIPIIPVLGEELIVRGKRKLFGIVRFAKDAQRLYNYGRTVLVETIGITPRPPFIIAEGQIEGYEEQWRQANVRNYAYLSYKPVALGNRLAPPPQRQAVPAPISDLVVAIAQADNDMKATTGIYDASLGQRGPQESGKAILARQKESDVANFGFVDNLSRSIRHLGRLLVNLCPKIYDRPGRVVRIVKPDQTHEIVTIGRPFEEKPGVMQFYDLNAGKYDITISVGPGYESKRQEFVASVLQLVQTAPQVAGFIMDLVVRHMDWPGAPEIADRLKKMLPPQLQEQDEEGQQEIPPEFRQKMEALLQQHAELTDALNKANEEIESKRAELESAERRAGMQAETQLTIAALKAQSTEGIELLRQQIAAVNKRMDLLHVAQTVEEDAAPRPQEEQVAA